LETKKRWSAFQQSIFAPKIPVSFCIRLALASGFINHCAAQMYLKTTLVLFLYPAVFARRFVLDLL